MKARIGRIALFAITALLSLLAPAGAQAGFTNIYFFGDSLTDTGNLFAATGGAVPSNPTYFNGRFSNGPVWAEYFADALGLAGAADPAFLGGGNYAVAGATISDFGRAQPELPQQLAGYLGTTGGVADANALYVIMGGSNDVVDALQTADPAAAMGNSAVLLSGMISDLYGAGARNLLISLIPDIGATPRLVEEGPLASTAATQLSIGFNLALQAILDSLEPLADLNLYELDLFGLQAGVLADPAGFGFSNVSDPCKEGELGLPPDPALGETLCSNAGDYFYYDAFHPTTGVHQLIALAALNAVPEPGTLALVALALLFVVRRTTAGSSR